MTQQVNLPLVMPASPVGLLVWILSSLLSTFHWCLWKSRRRYPKYCDVCHPSGRPAWTSWYPLQPGPDLDVVGIISVSVVYLWYVGLMAGKFLFSHFRQGINFLICTNFPLGSLRSIWPPTMVYYYLMNNLPLTPFYTEPPSFM